MLTNGELPGQEIVKLLVEKANERARLSLAAAKSLREQGFPSAAYVWAVRSVEIFTKEFLLAPLHLTEVGAWSGALEKASKLFGSSNWDKAYARLEEFVGPIDKMLTDTDEDAWKYWRKSAVRVRGDIVHGKDEASDEDAELVIAYAEQLLLQLTLRMIVSKKHPIRDMFLGILEEGSKTLSSDEGGSHAAE